MRRALAVGILAAVGVLGGARPASAWRQATNQRLDRALYREHAAPWVVAGRILATHGKPPEAPWDEGPDVRAVELEVMDVVLGSAESRGPRLRLDVAHFAWPEELVPLEKGVFAVLLLDLARPGEDRQDHVRAVVPVRDRRFEPAADREAVKRLLAGELLALLAVTSDADRQRHLILQAGPILTAEEARALHPFLGSEDPWLRRAALAGLVAATRRPGFVELAALDLRRFLETTDPRQMIPDPRRPGVSYDPHGYLFEHYFVLETGWSPEDRVPELLPLWRTVAATFRGDASSRWHRAVRALCELGTEEDLPLLWAFWEEARGENASIRQSVLRGLARILGVEVTAWGSADYPQHEQADLERVRAAARVR